MRESSQKFSSAVFSLAMRYNQLHSRWTDVEFLWQFRIEVEDLQREQAVARGDRFDGVSFLASVIESTAA